MSLVVAMRIQLEYWTTEGKMVGWHHWLKGRESEQVLGDGEGQGSLACCSPRGHKESDTTGQQQQRIQSCVCSSYNGGKETRRREWFHNKDGFSYYSTDYYITTIATKMNSPPGLSSYKCCCGKTFTYISWCTHHNDTSSFCYYAPFAWMGNRMWVSMWLR